LLQIATFRQQKSKHQTELDLLAPTVQVSLWWALMTAGAFVWAFVGIPAALIFLLAAQFIAFRPLKRRKADGAEAAESESC
jgi:cbb3-type cytochrome oxidase subunit 3